MLRSKIPYIVFILAALGVGCAAQNARYTQKRAEQLIQQLEAEKPNSPELKEASAKLAAAKKYQSAARYDKADQAFKESIEASEKAFAAPVMVEAPPAPEPLPLEPVVAKPAEEKPSVEAPVAEATHPVSKEASKEVAKAEAAKPPAPKPEFSKPENSANTSVNKRGMPAKALAKYLASKHALTAGAAEAGTAAAASASSKTKSVAPVASNQNTPEDTAARELEKTSAKTVEKPAEKIIEKPAEKPTAMMARESKLQGSGGGKTDLVVEEEGAENLKQNGEASAKTKVVEAPAAKVNKISPERTKEKVEEKVVAAPKEAPAKPTAKVMGKRKIPGAIEFKVNDPSIQGDAMTNLDQTSKFLLDNPSTTLVLQGVSASGELSNVTDSRFESIRSYLTAKGVPDDQIRLDPERKSGKSPQFELFLIEH